MPKFTLTGDDVAFRAALLRVVDELSVVQGILSAPTPRPLAARDIVDGIIVEISEVLQV